MDFESPQGLSFGLAGTFSVKQDRIATQFKKFGVKREKDVKKCDFIIANTDALSNKFVNDARAANLPVLNEDWIESVLEGQAWIVPDATHFHFEPGSPSAPEASEEKRKQDEEKRKQNEDEEKRKQDEEKRKQGGGDPPPDKDGHQTEDENESPDEESPDPDEESPDPDEESPEPEGDKSKGQHEGKRKPTGQAPPILKPAWGGRTVEGARAHWYNCSRAQNELVVAVHPADEHKPEHQQRKNYVLNIDFVVRHFLFVSDPQTEFPAHHIPAKTKRNLRASWLLPRKDQGAQGQAYIDKRGHVLSVTGDAILRGHKMDDFDWWGTATDGRVCYNPGILPGETEPQVWARTTQKKIWKHIDAEIDAIRQVFGQPALAEESVRRRTGDGKSRILENLVEGERWLKEEDDD
ncbi:hypothetical protein PLIIFM63780_010428 [Purpureocillium lilacinum]|nr:hypothetical protein PLIIFM63780_010428 [Purpureocillium lilacinum]